MRRQLFSIAELLEKANKILEKKLFVPSIDEPAIIELVTNCQDSAISMGEQIEKMYGEGTASVAILEQYCENLYLLTVFIQDAIKRREFYNILNKQLKKLRGVMNSELQDRLEVVFFPYKASMWDSLESVYLKAKEDENCDVYCVPIPYFDRNADGSLGQMHYEGNEYPTNIEITHWQAYNLEERRPDVIYIHNPYDEWNLVTCVHPIYFAKNLKKYTDKLVYIPYFVLDEIEPGDQNAIDGMKHFVWTPGVIYANQVILQSEKMKQIYVNEFIKAAKENGLGGDFIDRRKLEEKFLGTGSPKFEKVKNTRKEDLEIPEEWLKIIQKPDGSWKKIIFYNTSIGALLQNNEKMNVKIKNVLNVFYEKRDEVALLWRPHPLIETTLISMRPDLWENYKKIRDEYIQAGWGIYDDTPDMDRAIVLSDAYYGDESSVVALYQKTGKSIMVQNVEICNKGEEKMFPQFIRGILMGTELYMAAGNYNAIFCADIDSGELKFLTYAMEENIDKPYLLGDLLAEGKEIYFSPVLADGIHYYDLMKNTAVKIANTKGMYSMVQKYAGSVYMLPATASEIIRINIKNKKIEKRINIREILNVKYGISYNYLSNSGCYEYDDKLYFAGYEQAILIILNGVDNSVNIKRFNDNIDGFSKVVGDGNKMFLFGNDKILYEYEIDSGIIRKILDLQKWEEYSKIQNVFIHKYKLYCHNYVDSNLGVVDIQKMCDYETSISNEWNVGEEQCLIVCVQEGKIILQSPRKRFFIVDMELDNYGSVTMKFDERDLKPLKEQLKKQILNGRITRESVLINLQEYIA